jgi:hypothetical protein
MATDRKVKSSVKVKKCTKTTKELKLYEGEIKIDEKSPISEYAGHRVSPHPKKLFRNSSAADDIHLREMI